MSGRLRERPPVRIPDIPLVPHVRNHRLFARAELLEVRLRFTQAHLVRATGHIRFAELQGIILPVADRTDVPIVLNGEVTATRTSGHIRSHASLPQSRLDRLNPLLDALSSRLSDLVPDAEGGGEAEEQDDEGAQERAAVGLALVVDARER